MPNNALWKSLTDLRRLTLIAGADGIVVETHPQPQRALSDGPNMIPLAQMPGLVADLVKIFEASQ